MSTLLFELRPPACCENISPIPPSDLYPNTICEKCFTANSESSFNPESVYSIVQQNRCNVCGDMATKSIYTRSHSYPMLTLNVKEVLNLLCFRDLSFDYTQCDYKEVVVKIAQLVLDGRAEMENTKGSHIITANLTYLPETRSNALDHLRHKRAIDPGAALAFSQEDRIALGLMNALFHLDHRIVARASNARCSDSWRRWSRRPSFTKAQASEASPDSP